MKTYQSLKNFSLNITSFSVMTKKDDTLLRI